eukprot:7036446-Pyramimonas_sp.AAC.1
MHTVARVRRESPVESGVGVGVRVGVGGAQKFSLLSPEANRWIPKAGDGAGAGDVQRAHARMGAGGGDVQVQPAGSEPAHPGRAGPPAPVGTAGAAARGGGGPAGAHKGPTQSGGAGERDDRGARTGGGGGEGGPRSGVSDLGVRVVTRALYPVRYSLESLGGYVRVLIISALRGAGDRGHARVGGGRTSDGGGGQPAGAGGAPAGRKRRLRCPARGDLPGNDNDTSKRGGEARRATL